MNEWNKKPFDEWDEEDIVEVLAAIEEGNYKVGTKNEFRKGLKKLFKWLKGEDWPELKLLKKVKERNSTPDVLSEDDVFKMIDAEDHPRDKALIAVGYEAGLRIGELAHLKMKDIAWKTNSNGDLKAKIKVNGKTGERQIPLIVSVPYLKKWIEQHPFKDNMDAYIFCSFAHKDYGGLVTYKTAREIVINIAEKAGVKKKVHPHILRHTRATVLANHLTEAQMCEFFGWAQGLRMPRVYVHLSGRNIDPAIDKIYGMEEEEEDNNGKAVQPQNVRDVAILMLPPTGIVKGVL